MSKIALILFLTLIPSVAFADGSATSGTPGAPEVLGSAPTSSQSQIDAGRALLSRYLIVYLGLNGADKFLSDPRLILDSSVVRSGATGAGFNYFSSDFGLLSPGAIKDGLSYRAKNWEYFKKARARYGVDSYYILGILRLETYFGSFTARRSLPTTFYSIFVLDPARRDFAWRELAMFLYLAKRNGTDPFAVKGSVAGAYGIAQFIPTSVYNFAVDGNGDGRVNLFENADAIMSVANYLDKNGWANGAGRKRAIYSYNHDNGYVNAVLAYADGIKQIIEK